MRARMYRYGWSWSMLALLLLLVACSNGAGATASSVTAETTKTATTTLLAATVTQGVGKPGCRPASTMMTSAVGGPEAQGTGRGMEVWALFFGDLKVKHDQKIVWRLTGDGEPQFTTIGPEGGHARVVFGPTAHSGSNWQRPGDEWGIGF